MESTDLDEPVIKGKIRPSSLDADRCIRCDRTSCDTDATYCSSDTAVGTDVVYDVKS